MKTGKKDKEEAEHGLGSTSKVIKEEEEEGYSASAAASLGDGGGGDRHHHDQHSHIFMPSPPLHIHTLV